MRTCEKEVIQPITGTIVGCIPCWLKGTLLRNGPGSLKVGEYKFNHLFDSSALVHRFKHFYNFILIFFITYYQFKIFLFTC